MKVIAAAATPELAPRPAPAVSDRTKLLLEAPILPTILKLALPNVIVIVVQALSSAIDAFYLGRLGPEVLAGVALVFPVWMLMITMSGGGIGGGIASSVARALGGGRRTEANLLVAHSLVLSVILGLAFSGIVLAVGPWLYTVMGGSGAVLDAALAYSTVIFGGAIAIWIVNAFGSLMRGSGEMVVPATVIVGGEILHLCLAPLLIFGLGPFPALGVAGGGLSLVTSYVVRALVLGSFMFQGRASIHLPAFPIHLRRDVFWDILRVGLPGSVNTLLTNLNVMVVTSLVGASGVFALAGYGLASRLEYLQIPIVFGFGTALVTLVGTNFGAGQIERARRVAWTGAAVAACVTGAVGVLAAVFPLAWVGQFSADPGVQAVGSTYLRIVGPTFALFGLGLALYFAAQGSGHLLWPLIAGVIRLTLVVTVGWFLIHVLHAPIEYLFGLIAVGFAFFAAAQALAVNRAIRRR
jgi:putative MATE family efflux protein